MIREAITLASICLICNVNLEKAEINDRQLGINAAFVDGKNDFEMHYEDSWEEDDIPNVYEQGKSSQTERIRMPPFSRHKHGTNSLDFLFSILLSCLKIYCDLWEMRLFD